MENFEFRDLAAGLPLLGEETLNDDDGVSARSHASMEMSGDNRRRLLTCQTRMSIADPAFFAINPVSSLARWPSERLAMQGRVTHPMKYNVARDRFEVLEWSAAFAIVADYISDGKATRVFRYKMSPAVSRAALTAFVSLATDCGGMAQVPEDELLVPHTVGRMANGKSLTNVISIFGHLETTARPADAFSGNLADVAIHIATSISPIHLAPAETTLILPTFDHNELASSRAGLQLDIGEMLRSDHVIINGISNAVLTRRVKARPAFCTTYGA